MGLWLQSSRSFYPTSLKDRFSWRTDQVLWVMMSFFRGMQGRGIAPLRSAQTRLFWGPRLGIKSQGEHKLGAPVPMGPPGGGRAMGFSNIRIRRNLTRPGNTPTPTPAQEVILQGKASLEAHLPLDLRHLQKDTPSLPGWAEAQKAEATSTAPITPAVPTWLHTNAQATCMLSQRIATECHNGDARIPQ